MVYTKDNWSILTRPILYKRQAHARLTAAAVGACRELNPNNPIAAAEGSKALYKVSKRVVWELSGLPSTRKMIEETLAKIEENQKEDS